MTAVPFWHQSFQARPSPAALFHAGYRRFVRRDGIDRSQTFSLLAELALGLAGLTGVAAAFGGRERVDSHVDQLRLVGVFVAVGSALAGCLCVLTLLSAGVSPSSTYIWATVIAAFVLSPNMYPLIPQTLALVRDPEASTGAWIFVLVLAQFGACLSLFIGNLVVWRDAWPLFAAFSIQLTWGLFLFARVLTVRK
jgi:hypothetical protein